MKAYDKPFMERALALAAQGQAQGEVPVGCLIVHEGEVIAESFNQPITLHDPTAHAEILALRAAGARLGNYRLLGCTLYVTLQPCPMCLSAMAHARIARCVYGAPDSRVGVPLQNHQVSLEGGVLAEACSAQLVEFFRERR